MATKRLIDANNLYIKLGKIGREPDYQHEGEDWSVGIAIAMGEVWSEPTVDAVEVVRCKDCKHYVQGAYHDDEKMCDRWGEWIFPYDNDFCSMGERKDNG